MSGMPPLIASADLSPEQENVPENRWRVKYDLLEFLFGLKWGGGYCFGPLIFLPPIKRGNGRHGFISSPDLFKLSILLALPKIR